MFSLLSLPVTLTSLILFLFLTFLGNNISVWISALILSALSLSVIFRNDFRNINVKKYFSLKNLSLVSIIFLFVLTKAFVLSPFAFTKTTGNFKHLQITDVGDYYKHTFVVTVLKQDGIPPSHPYFPLAKLSYYYGYYLIPAAVSRLVNLPPNQVFYFYSLVTDFLGLLIIFRIFNRSLKTFLGKTLALLLLVTASGVNVLPEVLNKFPIFGLKINPEVFTVDQGFQLINNFKALLFVPQHFFAACLAVGLLYYLIWEKPRTAFTAVTAAFIFLSSIFVSWTAATWLLLLFIFSSKKRLFLIFSGVLTLISLLPYFSQLTNRDNLLYLNKLIPFEFVKNNPANIILTALVQYGPIIFLIGILVFLRGVNFFRKNLILILGFSVPLVITWFVRSPIFNDFSMRGLMPLQLVLPLLFPAIAERSKKYLRITLFSIAVFTISLGFLAFYLEYLRHWKNRFFLPPRVSKLLLEIRKLPDSTRLAAIDRDRWVELIPSLGFKKVLSPYLFDSYVYFAGELTTGHGQYERLALDLFIDPNIGPDTKDLVLKKNQQLSRMYNFFNSYKADFLILNNQLWFKGDVNPYLAMFLNMGVNNRPLTGDYTLLDYASLLGKISQNKLYIQEEKGIKLTIKDRKFPLTSGLWYLSSCSNRRYINLHFELEDYYLLFDQEIDGHNKACVGKIFYLQKSEDVRLTDNSNIEIIDAFPLVIHSLR